VGSGADIKALLYGKLGQTQTADVHPVMLTKVSIQTRNAKKLRMLRLLDPDFRQDDGEILDKWLLAQ
jgi:hypothetical protein